MLGSSTEYALLTIFNNDLAITNRLDSLLAHVFIHTELGCVTLVVVPSQPRCCKMELRKKVKRPQRYEPETDDAGRAERYLPPLNRPVFSVPIIEYNPDLRPAAFPTLDPAQTALSEQDHVVEPSETKSRQQADTVSIVQRPLRQLDSATSRAPDQIEARTGITPGIAVEDENRRASNCDDNPVYVRNMQLSQQWSQRTDHDWNIQEMETSDEEELQEETIAVSGTVRSHRVGPAFGCIGLMKE